MLEVKLVHLKSVSLILGVNHMMNMLAHVQSVRCADSGALWAKFCSSSLDLSIVHIPKTAIPQRETTEIYAGCWLHGVSMGACALSSTG